MKYLVFLALIITTFSACNENKKIITERLNVADSAVINYFKGNGSMDSVVAVKFVRDKKQLTQLVDFIAASSTGDMKCGYDGSIHFFKNNLVLQDIDFRMNDAQCMFFQLKIGGDTYTTKLSAEAKQLLESIKR